MNDYGTEKKQCFDDCEDVISRSAAINGVKTLHDVAWKNWHEPTLSANVVLDMIRELPAAEPEQRWIPCSERLPENDERVLATTAWGEVTIAERIYPPINDTCWFIHDGNTNATIDDVVAWTPLPEEPYKGES